MPIHYYVWNYGRAGFTGAANRKRFTPEVFSLLLGVTDENGVSPFWEAVGATITASFGIVDCAPVIQRIMLSPLPPAPWRAMTSV